MQGRVGFFLMQSLMFTESFNVRWVQQRLPYRTAPSIILPDAIHFQMHYFPHLTRVAISCSWYPPCV